MSVHMYTHMNPVYEYERKCKKEMHTYVCVRTCTQVSTFFSIISVSLAECMHEMDVYVWMYVCTCTHVCMYVCMDMQNPPLPAPCSLPVPSL